MWIIFVFVCQTFDPFQRVCLFPCAILYNVSWPLRFQIFEGCGSLSCCIVWPTWEHCFGTYLLYNLVVPFLGILLEFQELSLTYWHIEWSEGNYSPWTLNWNQWTPAVVAFRLVELQFGNPAIAISPSSDSNKTAEESIFAETEIVFLTVNMVLFCVYFQNTTGRLLLRN